MIARLDLLLSLFFLICHYRKKVQQLPFPSYKWLSYQTIGSQKYQIENCDIYSICTYILLSSNSKSCPFLLPVGLYFYLTYNHLNHILNELIISEILLFYSKMIGHNQIGRASCRERM